MDKKQETFFYALSTIMFLLLLLIFTRPIHDPYHSNFMDNSNTIISTEYWVFNNNDTDFIEPTFECRSMILAEHNETLIFACTILDDSITILNVTFKFYIISERFFNSIDFIRANGQNLTYYDHQTAPYVLRHVWPINCVAACYFVIDGPITTGDIATLEVFYK